MTKKLYSSKVIDTPEFDELMFDHRSAMTGEGLHSKSDIVVELAARDYELIKLRKLAGLANEFYGDVMPQIGNLVIQDFAALNELGIALSEHESSTKDLTFQDINGIFSQSQESSEDTVRETRDEWD